MNVFSATVACMIRTDAGNVSSGGSSQCYRACNSSADDFQERRARACTEGTMEKHILMRQPNHTLRLKAASDISKGARVRPQRWVNCDFLRHGMAALARGPQRFAMFPAPILRYKVLEGQQATAWSICRSIDWTAWTLEQFPGYWTTARAVVSKLASISRRWGTPSRPGLESGLEFLGNGRR